MSVKEATVLGLLAIAAAAPQEDGRYPGESAGQYRPDPNDGRYYPDYSGQYHPDYSGQYHPDGSGRYGGDDSGRYAGDDSGRYSEPPSPPPTRPSTTTTQAHHVPVNTYHNEGGWRILRLINNGENGDYLYHYDYLTENKINAEETGRLANKGTDAEAVRANGFYEYVGDDNKQYKVTYTADENGFVPEGEHIPKTPPEILRALEWLRARGEI